MITCIPIQHNQRVAREPRDGFGAGLLAAAAQDHRVVALVADLTESLRIGGFRDQYPDQFVQVGVAEQNMLSIAAGMALAGARPFAASFAVFNPGRNWDQLRVSVCYGALPVCVVGGHAGLSVGADGATHQALEDIAITRCLPNVTVLAPTDATQVQQAVLATLSHSKPVYLRFGRAAVPQLFSDDIPFVIGESYQIQEGSDVVICAHGAMVSVALDAAEALHGEISVSVVAVPTLSVLDLELIHHITSIGLVLSIEDHQRIGGLGSAIAESLSEVSGVRHRILGVDRVFGESGTVAQLYQVHRLTRQDVIEQIRDMIGKMQPHSVQ